MKQPSRFHLFIHWAFLKIPAFHLRRCSLRAESNGIELPYETLASHHLAGGRASSLVDGLIYAKQHGIELSVLNASARDLVSKYGSGISLIEHIQVLERAGHRKLDGAPLDISKLNLVNK